ncbi:MAG TPA: TonB-dependent receptor plug domain-containing protein, partial [Puia sp.]|nr:TonB-dependent receptor plug domain-containing protein [Puia sp.]
MTIKNFLTKTSVSLLFLCVLFTLNAFSQQKRTISGKILDDKGIPLQGVTIVAKTSKVATASDAAGGFKLNVPEAEKTLIISSIGFTTQEMDITGKTNVDVVMSGMGQSLGDIVVTGYGTARKKDLTGAVANITSKDFNQGIVTNPIQQIQGKVAGLVITTPGGDPNQAPLIRLRGQTSLSGGQNPLIVVDGIPLDNPDILNNMAPGDIASYDVLKDASATAIYGSRGANGVIIVNTKKGQAGQAKVEYNGYIGIDHQAKKLDILNAAQWRAATGAAGAAIDKGANTDWQDAITRTAFTQSHNVAVSGGSKGFNYRGSVSYINQEGIVINSGKE